MELEGSLPHSQVPATRRLYEASSIQSNKRIDRPRNSSIA